MQRWVKVSDCMQADYCYQLVAPAGRNFDPEFAPQLTPKELLQLGVFGFDRIFLILSIEKPGFDLPLLLLQEIQPAVDILLFLR